MDNKKIADTFSAERWDELRTASNYSISHGNGQVAVTAKEVLALMDLAEQAEAQPIEQEKKTA